MNSILGLVLAGGASTRLGQPKQYLKLHGEQAPDMLSRTVSLMAECTQEVRVSSRQGDSASDDYRDSFGNSFGDRNRDGWRDGRSNGGCKGKSGIGSNDECNDDCNGGCNIPHGRERDDGGVAYAPCPASPQHLAGCPALARPHVSPLPDIFDGFGPMSGIHAGLTALQYSTHEALLVLPCDLPFMTKAVLQRLLRHRHAAKEAFPDLLMTTYRQSHTGYIEALVSVYEPGCLPYFHQALEENRRQINLIVPSERIVDIVYTPAEARPFFNINFPEELAQASLYTP